MFKKNKEKLTNIDEFEEIKTNKSFKKDNKKSFKINKVKKIKDVKIKKEKSVKIKKENIKKEKQKENFKGFFKLTFARLLAKIIDICLIWLIMFLTISVYMIYAFNKVNNYIARVYTDSLEALNVSKDIIVERQVELENIQSFSELIFTLLKYDTLNILVTAYGIVFLGGYLTFYFIAMALVELLFVNKKGQTLGKKICNLRLTNGRKWWQTLLRSVIIYFANFFLMISYILRFRKRRAMAHEHLLNNYVVFNYDYKESDIRNDDKYKIDSK